MKSLLTKIISVVAILTLCIGFVGCNSTKNNENCNNGHNLIHQSYIAPTCKSNGQSTSKCSRCGYAETETLLPIAHDYQVKSTTPSTCVTNGSTIYECSMCHETKSEALPCLEHSYVNKTEPATCFADGYECEECSQCKGQKNIKVIPKLSHIFFSQNETDFSRCANCGVGSALYKVVKIQGYVHTEWNGQKYYCYAITMDIDRPETSYSIQIPDAIPTPENYYLAISHCKGQGEVNSLSYPKLVCQDGLPKMQKTNLIYFTDIDKYNYKIDFAERGYCTVTFNAKRNSSGNEFPKNEYPTTLKIDFSQTIGWIEI